MLKTQPTKVNIASTLPDRKSIRLPGFDYKSINAYFVTMVAEGRRCHFGRIETGEVRLSSIGLIAKRCWESIPEHFEHVELDAFVVMPNHVHGVLLISDESNIGLGKSKEVYGRPISGSLPTIIRSYKSAVTRECRVNHGQNLNLWQRNYFEHVIRDERSLEAIREYISLNPLQWEQDKEYVP